MNVDGVLPEDEWILDEFRAFAGACASYLVSRHSAGIFDRASCDLILVFSWDCRFGPAGQKRGIPSERRHFTDGFFRTGFFGVYS
jgi:hypothetical protein